MKENLKPEPTREQRYLEYLSKLKVGDQVAIISDHQRSFGWTVTKIEGKHLSVERNGEKYDIDDLVWIPGSKGLWN